MEKGISDKQAAFVREYVKDWNGKQAAIRAGYSIKSAEVTASRMLSDAKVAAAVEAARAEVAEVALVDSAEIVAELKKIAFGDLRDVMTWGPGGLKLQSSEEMSDKGAAALAEITEVEHETQFSSTRNFKVKRADKLRALELLSQYDVKKPAARREHSGPNGKAIEVTAKTWLDMMNEDDGSGEEDED